MAKPTRRELLWDTERLSIDEVMFATGLGRTMVSKLIKDGDLAATHIGRRVLVHTDSVRVLLDLQAAA